MKLTVEQELAAGDWTVRNIVVNAAPGSGKTHTLVSRYQFMVRERGIVPAQVAIITYTTAAAKELELRIMQREDGKLPMPGYVGTLHGFCLKLIRDTGHKLSVADDDVICIMLMDAMKNTSFRGDIMDAKKVVSNRSGHGLNHREQLLRKYYHQTMISEGLIDFDGVLIAFQGMLQSGLTRYAFKHLMIDEYQDVCTEDHELFMRMDIETRFIVGDPKQAIFGFRGGDPKHMLNLLQDPVWKGYDLSLNFRSGQAICRAASALAHHMRPFAGLVRPATDRPDKVDRVSVFNEDEQRRVMIEGIQAAGEQGNNVAVLCRFNWQCEAVIDTLRSNGIAVQTKRMAKKPSDWHILRAMVSFLANPKSEMLAYGLALAVKGEMEARRLKGEAVSSGRSLSGMIWCGTPPETPAKWMLIARSVGVLNAIEIAERIWESLPDSERTWIGFSAALANPSALEQETIHENRSVMVCTIHAFKGREADVVILPYWSEEMFPGTGRDADRLEEERRLAFVAVTRASYRVVVVTLENGPIHAKSRMPLPLRPSRFIEEMAL